MMNSYAWSTANTHSVERERAAQQLRDWELGRPRWGARWAAFVARITVRRRSRSSVEGAARPATVR